MILLGIAFVEIFAIECFQEKIEKACHHVKEFYIYVMIFVHIFADFWRKYPVETWYIFCCLSSYRITHTSGLMFW